MKGMFKIALYSFPVLGLVLLLVMGRLDKHDAQMELEKAQFDKEWAHNNEEFDKAFSVTKKEEAKEDKDTFWSDQRKEAEERLIEAKKRLAVTRGKVEAAGQAAEEALQEMDNSQAGSKPGIK